MSQFCLAMMIIGCSLLSYGLGMAHGQEHWYRKGYCEASQVRLTRMTEDLESWAKEARAKREADAP